MQDIITKIDERISGLLAFERHDLVSPNVVLAGLLALHADIALALRRIDFWQQTFERWLKTTGLSGPTDTHRDDELVLSGSRTLLHAKKQ